MTFKFFHKKGKSLSFQGDSTPPPIISSPIKESFIHQLAHPNPQVVKVPSKPSLKNNSIPKSKSNPHLTIQKVLVKKSKSTNFLNKFRKKPSNHNLANQTPESSNHEFDSNLKANRIHNASIRRAKTPSIDSKDVTLNEIIDPYEEMLIPVADKKFLKSMFDKRLQYRLKKVHTGNVPHDKRQPIVLSPKRTASVSSKVSQNQPETFVNDLDIQHERDDEVDNVLFNQNKNLMDGLELNEEIKLNEIPHSTEIEINESLVNHYDGSQTPDGRRRPRSKTLSQLLDASEFKNYRRSSTHSIGRPLSKSSRISVRESNLKSKRATLISSKAPSASTSVRGSMSSISTNMILNDLSSLNMEPVVNPLSYEEGEPLMSNHLSTINAEDLEDMNDSINKSNSILVSKARNLYLPSSMVPHKLEDFKSHGKSSNLEVEIYQDKHTGARNIDIPEGIYDTKENLKLGNKLTPILSEKRNYQTPLLKKYETMSKEHIDSITLDSSDNLSHSTSKKDSYVFQTADFNNSDEPENEKSSYPYTEFETIKDVNFQVIKRSDHSNLKMISSPVKSHTKNESIHEPQPLSVPKFDLANSGPEFRKFVQEDAMFSNDRKPTKYEHNIEYYLPPNPTTLISDNEVYRQEMLALIQTHSLMVNRKQDEISHLKDLLNQERRINTFLASPRSDLSPKSPASPRFHSSPRFAASQKFSGSAGPEESKRIRKSFIPMDITVTKESKPKNYYPYNTKTQHLLPPFDISSRNFNEPEEKNVDGASQKSNDNTIALKPFHKFKVTSPQQVDLMNYEALNGKFEGLGIQEHVIPEDANDALEKSIGEDNNNDSMNESIHSLPLFQNTKIRQAQVGSRSSIGSRSSVGSSSYFTAVDDSFDVESNSKSPEYYTIEEMSYLDNDNLDIQISGTKSTPSLFDDQRTEKRDFSGSTTMSSVMSKPQNSNDSILNSSYISSVTTPDSMEFEFKH